MKQGLMVLIFILFSVNFYSQENKSTYNSVGLEVQPEFPNGMNAFLEYISKNFKTKFVNGPLRGKVIVEFVIEKNGLIKDIRVLRDLGQGTGEEAIRVLKTCPIWKPGMIDGKPVRVVYTLPINIDVN